MNIDEGDPPALLDHQLVPVGATFTTWMDIRLFGWDHLFRSFDNLTILPNFTIIQLRFDKWYPYMGCGGPNSWPSSAATVFPEIPFTECFFLWKADAR